MKYQNIILQKEPTWIMKDLENSFYFIFLLTIGFQNFEN